MAPLSGLSRGFGQFVRTPGLGRRVVGLLALAIILLFAGNVATFVMIRRTAEFNDLVERNQQVRLVARETLTRLVDAETGQRGFLLTRRPEYLIIEQQAMNDLPGQLDELKTLTAGDPETEAAADRIADLSGEWLAQTNRAIDLARAERGDEAIAIVQSGEGKVLMDQIRTEVGTIDRVQAERLAVRRQQSEWAATTTVAANALVGFLVLLAGVFSVFLVAGYLRDIRAAKDELDRANEGLEQQVETRTQQLTVARDRAETLLREVNHRVGNSLQMVSSFISLQTRLLPDKGAKAALRDAQARIEAVAHVHRRLYTSGDLSAVAMDEYLEGLVEELRRSLGSDNEPADIKLATEPMQMAPDRAVSVGVVVSELVTNAVKYAYPSGAPGEIRVALANDGPGRAVLTVEDDGCGLGDGKIKGTGLGGKINKAMAASLKSVVKFDDKPGGVRARMVFDL